MEAAGAQVAAREVPMTETPAALGLSPEQVEDLLGAAGRAPSLHNSQPWRFRLTPYAIELHADPGRRLPVVDPDGRELRLACGAALFNLRIALHALHVRPVVTVLPDRARPDLLAVVRRGGHKQATPEQERLRRAIPKRRSNRRPYTDTPVATAERHALRRAAVAEGAWLHVVDDAGQRAATQDLVARAHAAQMADPAFRAELAAWTAVSGHRTDGVPLTASGPPPEPHDGWVRRDFTGGGGRARGPGTNFEDQPLIGVLSAHLSGPAADIQAGQALQRVLLTATDEGLATSLLSEVVEIPRTREDLRRLISGTRPPHALLRIGYGWPVTPTPRRPVHELLQPAQGT
jgi:nitroreductase